MELTNKKYIAFINEYLTNGLVAYKAYLTVYKNVTKETAEVNSTKLLQKQEVIEEINRRQQLSNTKHELKKDKIIEELFEVIKSCKFDNDLKDRANWLKAIDIMNKLGGFYQPDKVEHSGIPNITTIQLIEIKKPEDKKD